MPEGIGLVDAPAQGVVAVAGDLFGGSGLHVAFRRSVAVPHDPCLDDLVLGAVAVMLDGVPADAALGDVAVQVVGEAQVLADGKSVAGDMPG